jgi:hypothetical protein
MPDRCPREAALHGKSIVAWRALSLSTPAPSAPPSGFGGLTAPHGQANRLPCQECGRMRPRSTSSFISDRTSILIVDDLTNLTNMSLDKLGDIVGEIQKGKERAE